MADGAVIVYPNGDEWIVKYSGGFGHFEDESEATQAGRMMARRQQADLVVYDKHGGIKTHEVYVSKKPQPERKEGAS